MSTQVAASARWGLTLRSVLIAPRDGFAAAARAVERRRRAGQRPREGWTPYVLGAIGGAALMLLWLKIGAMAGLRDVPRGAFSWDLAIAAMAGGSVIALAGQGLFGIAGRRAVAALGGDADGAVLRLVWGTAFMPQVVALALLLPLDLVIVGTDTFTSEPLQDPLATLWAALSVAFAVSLLMWSLYLFVRGVGVTSRLGTWRAAVVVLVGTAGIGAVVAVMATGLSLAGSAS